ncbi:MAG TPA: SDR family oxidoreductase [Mycobacterium sp.]|nr:SDR family oxidoreductase [Mycobacterium sp.]
MFRKGDGDRRVAVVTGGAGAIGGAIVARLAPDHTVVVLDRAGDVVVDLGDADDVRRAAKLVLDRHGRCDVFVHAAAIFKSGPVEQIELGAWRQVQAVNVESALLLTQAFVPGMRDRGFGRVIFIVSNTFWSPPDGQMLSYVASKGALIGMARTLAVGLGRDGIAVTAVAPGLTRTSASATRAAAEFADTEAHMALHRPLTPDDTAAVVARLARDEAEALTGQTLTADGGLVMR